MKAVPSARTLTLSWLMLVLATAITYFIGDWQQHHGSAGLAAMAALGALTLYKGRLVIHDFMGLRSAAFLWRAVVLGWLGVVLALVGLAYYISL